ncbi:MAG: PDZ domain-containing protein [Luteolibacter sp.]|jgi:serine protease Do
MNRLISLATLFLTFGALPGHSQRANSHGVPLLTPSEKQAVDEQSAAFGRAIEPVLADAAQSTVRVWSGTRRLAYGTVIGDGSLVLTKWSELMRSRGDLRIEAAGRELRAVRTLGVYPDHDLAVLKVDGEPLQAVQFTDAEPGLGHFLAAPQPDGRLAAFGVVAVPSRNLKPSDQAFLGVTADPSHDAAGVKIDVVMDDSPAAKAGVMKGDILLSVDGREVNGLFELRNSLNGVPPGSMLPLVLQRAGEMLIRDVEVGGRPQLPRFPGARLQQMERMGGPISRVRDEFPSAIESDMRPLPNQVGGPVVDLQGRVIGITLARAGRTRSYVMPASAVIAVLQTAPEDPELAGVRIAAAQQDEPRQGIQAPRAMPAPSPAPGRGNAPGPERLGRHLADMQRLLELMGQEMDSLER